MLVTVVTEQATSAISRGLTYKSDVPIPVGSLVEVPLRNQLVTGMVIAVDNETKADDRIKSVAKILSNEPLLTEVHIKTLMWMCSYYLCTPRHVLQVMLTAPPWKLLIPKPRMIVRLNADAATIKGKKQVMILEALRGGDMPQDELLESTGAGRASLASLEEKGIVEIFEEKPEMQKSEPTPMHFDIKLSDDEQALLKTTEPTLLIDPSRNDERAKLYGKLAMAVQMQQKSSLILYPNIFAAAEASRFMQEAFPEIQVTLVHSGVKESVKRELFRRSKPRIIVGTRTALFSPLEHIGLIVIDDEHERTWKSEQTPRYHTRLTAEVLAKNSGAKLILASPTPSLDSLRHATGSGRYKLVDNSRGKPQEKVQMIDMTEANFGKVYPFTRPLIDAMEERLKKKEVTVLLLNRKGTATGLLCFECKRPMQTEAGIALSVITRGGRQWLLNKTSGEVMPMPETCPHCGSVKLRTVGAGTERVEELVRGIFPKAKTVRADSDTLENPGSMRAIIDNLEQGKIDILLGTQSVLSALRRHKVTLACVLVADVGLSAPDFRAGERVFQNVSTVLRSMNGRGEAIIQTFRKEAPEILSAIQGTPVEYLQEELKLREVAGYPPATQIIQLIVRRDHARALALHQMALKVGGNENVNIGMRDDSTPVTRAWLIELRGKNARKVVDKLPLQGVVIDVDPID